MTHHTDMTSQKLEIGHPFKDKASLRQHLLAIRRAIDAEQRAQWDIAIGLQLQIWCTQQGIQRLGVYWPIQSEPDLRATYAILHQNGVELALPVTVERDAPLQFARWVPGAAMVRDAVGVPVPEDLAFEALPPALLIPCVGFNRQRFRLGYGAGFYDRTLAGNTGIHSVGIAYACLESEFDAAEHDIALEMIMTERVIFE